MGCCQSIPLEQLHKWRQERDKFQPIPCWLERNGRYIDLNRWARFEPVVVSDIDDDEDMDDAAVYLGGPNYRIDCYNITWRLWYACGTSIPPVDEPWERFRWDRGEGSVAFA